jgi:hypothetical protein
VSKADKAKGGHSTGPESRHRSYYVPRLKEYRSITDLTQEDRESIADNLFGPSEWSEHEDLIRQLQKLAEDREKTSGLIEDPEPVGRPSDDDDDKPND